MSPTTKAQRRARDRMAHTGEKYTTALRAVLAEHPSVPGDRVNLQITEPLFDPFDAKADDAVDLVWPTGLLVPSRPPSICYLDLLHWVGLAKAANGHPDGERYELALVAARDAKAAGAAVFPLSGSHYMEIAKIQNRRHRADLAAIMEELSEFVSLTARSVIMRLELESAFDAHLGVFLPALGPLPLLGMGVNHSVGVMDDISYSADPRDRGQEARRLRALGFLNLLLSNQRSEFERTVLRGPQDDPTESSLLKRGWDPRAAVKVAGERLAREEELVEILDADPKWRKGRLRDVISARELTHEALDLFTLARMRRGAGFEKIFDDRPQIRQFVRGMPSMEVAIEMKTRYHRSRSSKWDVNTIFDIDAMSVSVPYCDAVVTERHAADTLNRAHVGGKMHTAIMASPGEMAEWFGTLS